MPTVIAKNITITDSVIEDLGIIIPGSSMVNLTEIYDFYEITSSTDLKKEVSYDIIVINNGTIDLNKKDSLKHISQESVFEDETKINRVTSLDESISYSLTWVNKVSLKLTITEGIYMLNWSYEIRSNTNDLTNFCKTNVIFNGTNHICTNVWPYAKYQFYSGTDLSNLTSGPIFVQIQYRRQGIYQPVYIRNAILSLTKM